MVSKSSHRFYDKGAPLLTDVGFKRGPQPQPESLAET